MMRKRNYEYVKIGKVRFFSKEYNPMNDKKSRDKMTKTVQDAWDSGRFKVNSGCWKKGNKPWNGELKGKGIMKSHTEGKTKDNYAPLKIVSLKLKEYSKTRTPIIKDTTIEVKIQNFLKQLNIEYFTHQYVNIKHGYQCDILIPSMNMVIECDGNYWHKYPIGTEIDHIRTKELLEKGFKVLRLWEFEIRKMDINEFKQLLPNKIEGRA